MRAAIVERFVTSRMTASPTDALGEHSIMALNSSWGRQRIETLADQFDLGRRQFSRRFKRQIGASPKQVACVLRAQKAITLLWAGNDPHSVIELCGFTDQSHLIREVAAYSNRRPTELIPVRESHAHRYFNNPDIDAFCCTTYL